MPRLIGKTSKAPLYTLMALLVATAVVSALESAGEIDLIPGYGRDNPTMRLPGSQYPRSY
ncbi:MULTISPECIES: hypothetical protein [unclassified Chamaesiphon]|uniref:hypothetical protein n=1 Tax=unclassified Chamaesiphon TaxID=2620921 RepID=UPI00286B3BB2|nr:MULTISPECIES: hypothetical protein [unclassified Chamaesiphon]